MGNQLAGIAPSQIFPVETYLTELNDFTFEGSLGSTRFLKVAKCMTSEGLVVVKVFVIHESSLSLGQYQAQVEDVTKKLMDSPNCLQFHHTELTERAGFMFRQYVKSNLYDRISTRPFLTSVEKKWIAFQLLKALEQCHKQKVCHGDIKLENVMITSWTWLLLADFASFKPMLLPEDNPADYSYFFDTSRRRICYIAPERFIKSPQSDVILTHNQPPIDIEDNKNALQPSMDIFSAGCALAELFTEGCAPFDLTQLLSYRQGIYNPSKVLSKIDDAHVKALVEHMLQLDPSARLSASQYLERERGKTFPGYFYDFLLNFMAAFVVTPTMPADEKIMKIRNSLPEILTNLGLEFTQEIRTSNQGTQGEACKSSEQDSSKLEEGSSSSEKQDEYEDQKEDEEAPKCDGLIIITSLVTSCLRDLKFIASKLAALELLGKLAHHVHDDIILDRILPYVFYLVHDQEARVRVCSIHTLTNCLTLVRHVPRSDANIFPEYILPNLADLTQDSSIVVRQAFAENIATIAQTALRFLEYSQLQEMVPSNSYETELVTLQESVQRRVADLLSDPSNDVKRTLMEKTVTKLCVFFGKQKAHDVLLSHMLTFLNDKHDRHLRASFFSSVVGVATYVGCHCADILKPLLLQGLSDTEESVVVEAIEAMTALTELGLFGAQLQCELLADSAPLLIHPNLWIRQAVVGLVAVVGRTLPLVDVHTLLLSKLRPFLIKPLCQLHKEVCVLAHLRSPVSREVYDDLVRCPDVKSVLSLFQEARQNKITLGQLPSSCSQLDHPTRKLIQRLVGNGLTDADVDQLLLMEAHLIRIQKYKKGTDASTTTYSSQHGVINLEEMKKSVKTYHRNLENGRPSYSSALNLSQKGIAQSPSIAMNKEWQAMFGAGEERVSPTRTENRSVSPSDSEVPQNGRKSPSPKQEGTPPKRNVKKYYAHCNTDLEYLVKSKRDEYQVSALKRQTIEKQATEARLPLAGWKPKGHLIGHLHEHKAAVNRLIAVNDALYASCSDDGTVKIWDCNRIERKFPINRSKAMYTQQEGRIIALASCHNHQNLASASSDGSIHVFSVNRLSLKNSRQLDKNEDGFVVDMNYFDTGSESVLTYATVYGSIVGWDPRAPGTAWRLENGPSKGVITSFAVEGTQSWLAVGTSRGQLVCWDLRFMLPISTIHHPSNVGIRSVAMHPSKSSLVVAAVSENNEVSMWNMETQERELTMVASQLQPVAPKQGYNNYVCGMYIGQDDRGHIFVVTGGTDGRIRYWDPENPESSYIVAFSANDAYSHYHHSYAMSLVDGTSVISEMASRPRSTASGNADNPKRGPDQPVTGHKDTVSDVLVMNTPQTLVISSARDGTVKMWK